jgi:uncharacterized ubiquitin-like protein YukD
MLNYDVLNHIQELGIEDGLWDLPDLYNFRIALGHHRFCIPPSLVPLVLEHYASIGDTEKFLKFHKRIDLNRDKSLLVQDALSKKQESVVCKYSKFWDSLHGTYSPFITAIKYDQIEILKISTETSQDMIFNAILYSRLEILKFFKVCKNYNFSTFDLDFALQTNAEDIIDLILESKQLVINTATLLAKLSNSHITKKLLEKSKLTRLGYSCLIANARENGYSATIQLLEEYKIKHYP